MSMSPLSQSESSREKSVRPRKTSWGSRLSLSRANSFNLMRENLPKLGIEPTIKHEGGPDGVDEDRKERLEAVKRWYYDDWSNIDKKLQSSVVEGISVFLSLFDDNPPVKRLFCPPAEVY